MARPTKTKKADAPEAESKAGRKIDDRAAGNKFAEFTKRQMMYEQESEDSIQNAVYMRTGCLPLDLATGGKGIPRGRFMMLYSDPGAGKTTLLFTAARGLCLNGYKVLYVDIESSDDTAAQMGLIGPDDKLKVPKGSFQYLSLSTYKQLEKVFDGFLESSFDLIIVDSMTATTVSRDARRKVGKSVEDPSQIGRDARVQTDLLKGFYADIKDSDQSCIYIVQTRVKIDMKNPMATGPAAAGSALSKFASNVTIRMKPSILIKEGVRVVGRQAFLYVDKGRHGPVMINIPTTVIFGHGVSNIDLLAKLGKWLGVFSARGSLWDIELPNQPVITVNGRVQLNNWIKDHYDALAGTFYDNALDFLLYLGNGEKEIATESMPEQPVSFKTQAEYDAGEDISDEELDAMDGDAGVVNEVSDEEIESAMGEDE